MAGNRKRGNFLFYLIAIILFSLLSIYYVNLSFHKKSDDILALKNTSTSLRGNDEKLQQELEFLKNKISQLEKQNEDKLNKIKSSHLSSIEDIEERNKYEKKLIIDKIENLSEEKNRIQEEINLENEKLKLEIQQLKEQNQKLIEEYEKEKDTGKELQNDLEDKIIENEINQLEFKHNENPQDSQPFSLSNNKFLHNQPPPKVNNPEDNKYMHNQPPPKVQQSKYKDFRNQNLNQEDLNKYIVGSESNKKKSSLFDSLQNLENNSKKKLNNNNNNIIQNKNSNFDNTDISSSKKKQPSSYNLSISNSNNIKKKIESYKSHRDYKSNTSLCEQPEIIQELSKKRSVEAYDPPQQASNSEKTQWVNMVNQMKSKVSSMKLGGESLRNLIKDELNRLEIERLNLFCQYE